MADFAAQPRGEPTSITGYRGPEDQLSQRVVADMKDRILLYQPEATPFLTLSGRIKGKRKAFNLKFEWLEKDFKPRKLTVTGTVTDVATTVNLIANDGLKVAANDMLQNTRTGEIILVSSIATDALTVVRAIGGVGVDMNDQDNLIILGSSYPDNSLLGTPKSWLEYPNFNYTQIFRTPFAFTGRDLVTELYGGDDKMTETKVQAIEHKKSIEYAFYFGKRHLIAGSAGVKQRTFTGGIDWAINTNAWNVSGIQLNKRVFDEFLEEGLRWGKGGTYFGGGTKYLLCASRWLTEINSWADQKLQYRVLDKQIGFKATEYVSAHGTVLLVRSPILDLYHPDRAYLLDFNHLDYVYLRKRDTRLLDNREENDRDGEAYEFMSDVGVEVEEEFAHSKLFGISI